MWMTRSRSASSTYGRRSCGVNERHFFPAIQIEFEIKTRKIWKINGALARGVKRWMGNTLLIAFGLRADESIMYKCILYYLFQGKLVLRAYLNCVCACPFLVSRIGLTTPNLTKNNFIYECNRAFRRPHEITCFNVPFGSCVCLSSMFVYVLLELLESSVK